MKLEQGAPLTSRAFTARQVPHLYRTSLAMDPLPPTHPNPQFQSRSGNQKELDLSSEPAGKRNQIQITSGKY